MSVNLQIPEPEHCECGHRVKWFARCEPDELTKALGFEGLEVKQDVVERPCPHRNGTVIQHCPACDRVVGMWGCGPAGMVDCDCWEE